MIIKNFYNKFCLIIYFNKLNQCLCCLLPFFVALACFLRDFGVVPAAYDAYYAYNYGFFCAISTFFSYSSATFIPAQVSTNLSPDSFPASLAAASAELSLIFYCFKSKLKKCTS